MPNQSPETSSMDQVRELLMGTQLKEMENRLQRQEEALLREIANLRESVQNRVDSLENFMKSETSSLLHRLQEEKAERSAALKNEQKERAEAVKAEHKDREEALKAERKEREEAFVRLAKALEAKEEGLERKIAALSSTLDTAEQTLRQLMLSENARLSQSVEEKYKEVINALSTSALQIRHDVVSRSAISAMFAEAAMRFSGQAAGDGKKEEQNADADES